MEYQKIITNIINKWDRDNGLNIPPDTLKMLVYALSDNKIPYSSKQARKASQRYSREATRVFRDYQDKLKGNLSQFNEALRKRPKYCPNWLWRWGAHFFIDISVIEKPIFKNDEDLSTDAN